MDVLKRYRRHKRIEHPIYTVSEAAQKGLGASDWRETIGGGWGITDDGYVVECLARNQYTTKRGTVTYLRFTIGGIWLTKSARLLWLARKESHCHGSGTKTWVELEMNRTRFKNLLKAYVAQYMAGTIDWETLGRIYRRSDPKRVESAQRMIKRPEVQKMVDESVKEALTKAGVTREWALAMLPEALRIAKQNDDAEVVLKIYKEVRPLVGLDTTPNHGDHILPDFTPYEQIVEGEEKARQVNAALIKVEPDVPTE